MSTTQENQPQFEIKDLHVTVEGKEVLKGVNLKVMPGEVHAVMGRNGTGKTTLSYTLMGHPKYKVTQGKILLKGEDITGLPADERAKRRLFLAFQYPVAIPGVSVASFLRASMKSVRGGEVQPAQFRTLIKEQLKQLSIPETFMTRSMNDGFSGGEKKRLETLQLRLLQPAMCVLDETDSGLDIDALRIVSENIQNFKSEERSWLIITHYQRMLNYVKPDIVHVFGSGKILQSGGADLALKLEAQGYDWVAGA
ncbi:MAG: Fe-S cluster assembly ATPase SufC [Bdellovibrionales bacterium]|nr:Fe-S cluster assembly ATPase SufC [Bdellovibrionales bacterium]